MNFFVKDGAFYITSYGKAQKVVNRARSAPLWKMAPRKLLISKNAPVAQVDRASAF
jgi:hypothetical protein